MGRRFKDEENSVCGKAASYRQTRSVLPRRRA